MKVNIPLDAQANTHLISQKFKHLQTFPLFPKHSLFNPVNLVEFSKNQQFKVFALVLLRS